MRGPFHPVSLSTPLTIERNTTENLFGTNLLSINFPRHPLTLPPINMCKCSQHSYTCGHVSRWYASCCKCNVCQTPPSNWDTETNPPICLKTSKPCEICPEVKFSTRFHSSKCPECDKKSKAAEWKRMFEQRENGTKWHRGWGKFCDVVCLGPR